MQLKKQPTSVRFWDVLRPSIDSWLKQNPKVKLTEMVNLAVQSYISNPQKIEVELTAVTVDEGMAMMDDLYKQHKTSIDKLQNQ